MALVSVTRLRLRSFRFFLPFLVHTTQSRRQLRRSQGFIEGCVSIEFPRAFWTITVWENGEAMRAFRNSGAHLRAMPRLLNWCDEASYGHWEEEGAQMPSFDAAYERLRDAGTVSKVLHPSAAHIARQTVSAARPRPAPSFRPSA